MNFDEIKNYHETLKAKGVYQDLDLAQFTQEMQQQFPDRDWSQGLGADNWVGTMSRGIDTGVKATGLPDLASNVTGFIGQGADALAGRSDQHYEKIARDVGQGLPRMAADVGLMIGGGALTAAGAAATATGVGAPLGAPTAALGAGLFSAGVADAGIKGYADSGSVKQGLTSAALMGLAPGIGSVGTKLGLKVLPKALANSGAARVAAAQLGEQTAFMGAMSVEQAINGHNPFTVDNLFANAVGMAAFSPLMVKSGIDVYRTTPKAAGPKTWKPEITADQSVKGGAVNDMAKLTDYLLGVPDADVPNFINQAGGLRQALELTGLQPVGLSSTEQVSALGQRMRAKKMVQEVDIGEQPMGVGGRVEFFKTKEEAESALAGFPAGSTIVQTGGGQTPKVGPKGGKLKGANKGVDTAGTQWRVKEPEKPAVLSDEWNALADEAAKLLMADSGSLVDTLKIIQMANKFQTKFARAEDQTRLAQVGEGQQTVKGKVKPKATKNEGDKYGNPVVSPLTGNALEQSRTGLDPYTTPVGERPAASRGRRKTPEEMFVEEPIDPAVVNPAKAKKSKVEEWAERKITESRGNLGSGIDPELMVAYGVKGAYHLARGVNNFVEWSGRMIGEFGEGIKPHLEGIFSKSQSLHQEREQFRSSESREPLSDLRGIPLYHGTAKAFPVKDYNFPGTPKYKEANDYSIGIHLTPDKKSAAGWAGEKGVVLPDQYYVGNKAVDGFKHEFTPAEQKVLGVDEPGYNYESLLYDFDAKQVREKLVSLGYDAVLSKNDSGQVAEVTALTAKALSDKPKQVLKPDVEYFHGTDNDWTQVDFNAKRNTDAKDGGVLYTTTSKEEAKLAGHPNRDKSIVKKITPDFKNPLVIDAKGTQKERSFGKAGYSKAIEIARAKGHDSVLVKNVIDFGSVPQDTLILLKPEQVLGQERIQYSLTDLEPSGRDANGLYTAESMRAEVDRLLKIEPDPEVAFTRLVQKAKNHLADELTQDPMSMMDQVFSSIGLSPKLKSAWLRSAWRVVDQLHSPGTRYATTQVMHGAYGGKVNADLLRGVYFPKEKLVTVSTDKSYFANKELAAYDSLVTLAHESGHNLMRDLIVDDHFGIDNFRKVHAERAREFASNRTVAERYDDLFRLFDDLAPGKMTDERFLAIDDWAKNASKSVEEYVIEYGAALVTAKATVEMKRNALRFVPEPMRDFVMTMIRGMSELRKLVLNEFSATNPRGEALKGFQKDLEMLYSKDPVMESLKESIVKTVAPLNALEKGDYSGGDLQFSKVGLKSLDRRVDEHLQVRQSSGFVRNVMQHAQISAGAFYKEHFPAYQKLVGALTTMDGLAVGFQHAIKKSFMISTDGGLLKSLSSLSDSKLTPEQIKLKSVIGRIEKSPKLQQAANDAMLLTNELVVKAAETQTAYPAFDHPDIQAKLSNLTPNEIADVNQIYNAYLDANSTAAQLQVKGEVTRLQFVAADYLLGAGIPHYQAHNLGIRLFDAVLSGDPQRMPMELVGNDGADAFMAHWERVKPQFEKFQQNLDRPYFTEFRSGRWGVRYEVLDAEGKVVDTGYRSTNDRFQWKAIQREVAQDPKNRIIDLPDHQKDPKGRFGQMQTRGLEEATNLVRAHYDAAMANMKPEMVAMFEDAGFDPAQPLVSKMNADLKTMAPRRLAPGREKINMIAAQDAYSSLIARKLANTETRLHSNWLLKHESWGKDKLLKQEVQQFRDNILSAGRQEMQGFRKITTMLTMGANVSSAIVDMTQPLSMGVWRATQEVGFKNALKYTSEGFVEAFKPIEKISDSVFKDILVQAINRGYLKTGGSLDNFLSSDDTINYNVVKAQSNRDLADMKTMLTDGEFLTSVVFDQFSKLSDKSMEYAMTPMRLSAQLNNRNSLWVGYKMGLEKGLKGQQLFDAAVNSMQTINLQGQRAAHSSFKMKAGHGNGLVEAATLMTNYPIAVFAQLTSSWQGMLKSSGLDAATRQKSAQAFAGQVLTQMAFAGVGGLGIKSLFTFAKEMFGVDPEDAVRQGLATIDESGTLGEVLLNGVVNSTTGLDVSSRYDLGGLGGFNPYTGFDAKGLFGAGGGVISALYNAPGQFSRGDMSKVQLIPTGLRRMMTAWGDDAYKDASGQQIINPTVNERFTQMIGFKPARMAKLLEQKSTMRDIDKFASDRKTSRKAELMALMSDNRMPEVMQSLQEDVLADMQGPEYADLDSRELRDVQQKLTREKMMDLVSYGVEKLLPYDAMAEGTGTTGQAKNLSAQSFGSDLGPRQSEATREALKQQMLQQMGMKLPRNAPKAIRNAQMVDEIIRQNPTMTRSQALALLHGR